MRRIIGRRRNKKNEGRETWPLDRPTQKWKQREKNVTKIIDRSRTKKWKCRNRK